MKVILILQQIFTILFSAPNQGPMGHPMQGHPAMHYQHARQPMPPGGQGQVGGYPNQVQPQPGQQPQQHG